MQKLQLDDMGGAAAPQTEMSDQERDRLLLARTRNGDHDAFAELVGHYRGWIFSLTQRLLGNRQDAEEVTQDTFIKALRGLDRFRGDAAFSTWLYRIAINGVRNHYTFWSRQKRGRTASLDAPLENDSPTTLGDLIQAEYDSPYDTVASEDLLERVRRGMDRLPPKHREVLVLRNVHEASYEEIARQLTISVGTVKSRIARARETLRELSFAERSPEYS
jgi:RNA polymerase sigma-70 factor (ECF subfamily)